MSKRNKVKTAVTVGVFALAVVASLTVRLSNPAMTETQLLINFWPLWAIMVAALLAVAAWNAKTELNNA